MTLLPFLLTAALASAQTPDKGYVVRVDSDTVWLDLSAPDGASAGRAFEVYSEGAELKHPVTGASLGRVRETVAAGTLTEVADSFSVGRVSSRRSEVKAGQRARLPAAAHAPVPAAPAVAPADSGARAPRTRGATLGYAVVAMAVADFDGSGRPQAALAADDAVRVYPYPVLDPKPLSEAPIAGTGARAVGLEAADLDGDGRAELFVSVYSEGFKRFETRVLKLDGGRWSVAAELPFLTRSYQDGSGARVLATQQVVDDKTFPFGSIYPLAFRDGKYVQDRPAIKPRRVDWVYSFTTARVGEGEPAVVMLTNTRALRVQLGRESWRTVEAEYGQTPVRVRWHDRLLEFHPPMAASYGPAGFEALYAVRNMAALGGLATPFGLFNRGELLAKRWNGLALETVWKADLSGCAQGVALVQPEPGRRELAVAVRGSAGQSSVWTFDP